MPWGRSVLNPVLRPTTPAAPATAAAAAAAPGAANVSAQDPNICIPLNHLVTICKLDTGMSKMKGEPHLLQSEKQLCRVTGYSYCWSTVLLLVGSSSV
jgi:hypothetical protein